LPHLNVVGVDCHIGSQLSEVTPFVDALDRLLIPMDRALGHLPAVSLGEDSAFYLQRGQAVKVPGPDCGPVRLYGAGETFLGVGEMLGDGRVAPRRLLRQLDEEE